jgi:hypothetical protein
MKAIEHGAIIKISTGMLIAIGSGLVGGTVSIVTISNASDQNRKDLSKLENRMKELEVMREDVAVTRTKVEQIERLLERERK